MRFFAATAAFACVIMLAACGGAVEPTPTPGSGTGMEPTSTASLSTYPRTGHAPDYSWVAGRVTFTKIQAGCVYVLTDPADISAFEGALTPQPDTGVITGPVVSTAVSGSGSESQPLSEITPETGATSTAPPTSRFVPGGDGWDPSSVKDGDYVVLVGRLAGEGDTREMCPGGTAYVVNSVVRQP